MIDIESVRRDTPSCARLIHFNNAGASLLPVAVTRAVEAYERKEGELGAYEAEMHGQHELESVYDSIARLVGASRDEIALTDSATRAWDSAFFSIPFESGDQILVSHAEYISNILAFLHMRERTGVEIVVVKNDEAGQIDLGHLRAVAGSRAKLIALTHVPTSSGLVNPIEEVGKIARERGILYLVDACQSAGQIPLDVDRIGCDFLSATGRKFMRAPRGTGFLYVRKEALPRTRPWVVDSRAATWTSRESYELRDDARRFECYEANFASRVGLGAAADYAMELGVLAIWERVQALAATLRARLASVPRVTLHDQGAVQCGIVTFTAEGVASASIRERLHPMAINVWVSPAAAAKLDLEERGVPDVVRASLHYFNTDAEIGRLIVELERILSEA
jgi:selenocysteine lyase/cysteine desulfurase